MSTPATIAVRQDDNFKFVYLHNDGCPEWAGRTLLNYYNSQSRAENLISLGYLSVLGKYPSPPAGVRHSFNRPAPNTTIAYARDRDEAFEQDTAPACNNAADTIAQLMVHGDYLYLYQNGEWLFASTNPQTGELPKQFRKLSSVLKTSQKR